MADGTEQSLDPVDVMLAELARRVREAAKNERWTTFQLVMKGGRPELLREETTTRAVDLTDRY